MPAPSRAPAGADLPAEGALRRTSMPRRRWLWSLAGWLLAGCATVPPPSAGRPAPRPAEAPRPEDESLPLRLVIGGALALPEPYVPPAGAVALVELRSSADAPPLGAQRIELAGQAWPLRFQLEADRTGPMGEAPAALQGAVLVEGEAVWETEVIEIPPVPGPVELGLLWMRRVSTEGPTDLHG